MSNRAGENNTKTKGHTSSSTGKQSASKNHLSPELIEAIQHMVANISKSFIVEWYTSISATNHDFVASCETLIEKALTKLAELCVMKLDKYKVGQLVTSLLHDHILNDKSIEKIRSIEGQIVEHEYDICQNSVVRLFGLLCTDELRRVIFTQDFPSSTDLSKKNGDKPSQAPQRGPLNQNHDTSKCGAPKPTSALYTLLIAMLTKAVFMATVESISAPNWLYAVIIWLCKKEGSDRAKEGTEYNQSQLSSTARNDSKYSRSDFSPQETNATARHQPTSIIVTNTRSARSLDLEEGIDIASANINFENPICDSLKRPLDNIEIYGTEEVKGNNSCYVLYCIGYDGLCHRHPSIGQFNFTSDQSEIPIIDKRATNIINRRIRSNQTGTSSTINYADISGRKSFRRRMTIKRRFREFVILQLRLEENPKIRPYMKNIPKPTKLKAATQSIFSLPGITSIKLDQSTIKLRQRFLERFLIALNSSPFIANSYEFKEFFSYNLNSGGVNITKSKSLILQVNLNKVFVDSVRSAMSIIRSTLPGDHYHGLGSNPDPDAWLIELQQSTMKLHVQTRTSHSKMNLERYIDSKLLCMNDSPVMMSKSSSLNRNSDVSRFQCQIAQTRGGSLRANYMIRSQSTSSTTNSSSMLLSTSSLNSPNVTPSSRSSSEETVYYDASSSITDDISTECDHINISNDLPIASNFIDIMHYSITENSLCSNTSINFMIRMLLGKTIERYAARLLEAAFTLNNATFCINGITSSIWDKSDDPPLDVEHASLEEAVLELTKLIERNYANYTFIPKQLLNSLLSKQLRFYLSQLQSQKRNKFVIYSFFVHLLDELENVE